LFAYATKKISWLPIIVIVIVGLYLKSFGTGTPRPATQAPPVATNNTRAAAEPAPHVPQHTESQHSDHKQLYLKIVGVHDGDTMDYGLVANSSAGDSLQKCR